jgi:RNA polymerase sigma-70 factor (ECF subfamily)
MNDEVHRVPGAVQPSPTGGSDASKELFAQHVVPEIEVLLRVARNLTRDGAEAEDLVQDTLLRAFKAIGTFDGRHPRAWLLTILRNTNINRHRRRRPELLDDPDRTMATVADTSPSGESPEGLVVGATFDAVVEDALAQLPEDFRRTIELVDIEGLSYKEAAQVLDVPIGTIMSRVHRARHRLRDRLAAADLAPRSHR